MLPSSDYRRSDRGPVLLDSEHSATITIVKPLPIRLFTHDRHPIPRPDGRAMGCLSWVIRRKMTAISRAHTVYTDSLLTLDHLCHWFGPIYFSIWPNMKKKTYQGSLHTIKSSDHRNQTQFIDEFCIPASGSRHNFSVARIRSAMYVKLCESCPQ